MLHPTIGRDFHKAVRQTIPSPHRSTRERLTRRNR